ncbi:MAG TPA: hypothetical protein VF116_05940 [Ktedonobacterales bacterium]
MGGGHGVPDAQPDTAAHGSTHERRTAVAHAGGGHRSRVPTAQRRGKAHAHAGAGLDLGGGDTGQRQSLRAYSLALLDQLLAVVVTCTLISYSLYTFVSGTADHTLMVTIPFVIFGLFRYLYLLYVKGDGERPDELLWRDRQTLGSVALCVVAVLLLLYVLPC